MKVREEARLQQVADGFPTKYPWWHPFLRDGVFYADDAGESPRCLCGSPTVVFAFGKQQGFSATRWRF